ncbi:FYVE, RhoGEF and PH domain-containing protein 5-like isoform X2 [Syngnathoides biaculeatus]|uniref:FYVE, RhoGEF and PH domain-containing protein 5-like isoform X2 n=1 Tax=Syngnathoides biaculeatus TaxID=300417 RepID=UPI002ADDC40D|nr:FYVE, RhoGEF and PH domain-containing protein 5-like isoform X2 [Syngnathoides biaculeatus]
MSTDCSKPCVAPKPTPLCRTRVTLMSTARGPKPSVAPKPIPKLHSREPLLFGFPEGYINGGLNGAGGPNKKASEQDGVLSPNRTTRDKEEEMLPKMDEERRLTDTTLTEEIDSLDTLWTSSDRLTTDTEDAVEMIDTTDVTEDMDEDGGEGLADTDGLSMGDISVNSVDEENGPGIKKISQRREELDDTTESLTDDLLSEATQPAPASDDGTPCKTFKDDHKNAANLLLSSIAEDRDVHFSDQKQICHEAKRHIVLEDCQNHKPYYVSPENIIMHEMIPNHNKTFGVQRSPLSPQRHCGLLAGKYHMSQAPRGPVGYQRSRSVTGEEHKLDAWLNRMHCQPNSRLLCNSDTSLSASFAGNHLILPGKSEFFRHAAGGDVTDTDISDEYLYEDLGDDSSEGENVFPLSRSTSGTRSRSLSHHMNSKAGGRLVHGARFSQKGPVLSSSPMLKGYTKPHYLPLYPPSSTSTPVSGHRDTEGSPCGRFSRFSPLSSSGLSTPASGVDIPPPFELAYITKRPIAKSSPSLLIDVDSPEKNRKKKSSIKRFLMLKFRRKVESKSTNPSSSESSTESSHLTTSRLLEPDRHSNASSPRLLHRSVCQPRASPEASPAFLFYPNASRTRSSVAFLNRSVVRVESFEERSRVPFSPLPLTKPRSISFPNADTSDYENVPAVNADYENIQVPQWRPVRPRPLADFFERPTRVPSSANETDGYVDMSSLPGFDVKTKSSAQEAESAYTEAYKVCAIAAGPQSQAIEAVNGHSAADDDAGRTSDEEDAGAQSNYDRQIDGRSRAFYIAMDLVDTERIHVKALKFLQEDFREAVGSAVGDDGEPVLDEKRLCEILNELPDVYLLHRKILTELENRTRQWDESQRIADIFLSRKVDFLLFTTYIGHYDRSMNLLEESCRNSAAFAAIVHQFEQRSPSGQTVSVQQQLLQVIVRVAQYRMILTDYLNNLSPDSQEYEDTQAAVVIVADIADQANDSLRHGENLLRLVNIEYSVHGQRDLLQPGRVFVKEGTMMKVSRRSRQPRHLFLMNDILLYTYPQQDGKYRLKNTLSLTGLKVTKPILENVQHALRMEGPEISITLSASSFVEREDWFYTLSRAVSEHTRGSALFNNCSGEARDRLRVTLGEKPPTLVPVSQAMMCMNCTSDFSLTLRRHHCLSCGRIVCRSCSKNRYPLKYMKERMAKVCDHCYNELKKKGEDPCTVTAKSSPRVSRPTRPLSSVFQSIHPPNILRHRKGMLTFDQMTVSDEGSISGSLHRSKKSKRNWKRLWFLLKDKEKVASESLPLLGFTVKLPDNRQGDDDASNVFQLYHKNTLYYTFKAEDNYTAQRWVNAMEEATVL